MDLETESSSHLAEAKIHLDKAYSYEQSQEFDQVVAECDFAIEIAPDLSEAYNLKGVALEELGRKVEAIEAYKQATDLDPEFSEAKDKLAALNDECALLPRWLLNLITGILVSIVIFLATTYGIESFIVLKVQISTLDRLLLFVLTILYTPGFIVQSFIGNEGLQDPGLFGDINWTIRIVSSLPFVCIGVAAALRRRRALLIIAVLLLLLYSLMCGIWSILAFLAWQFHRVNLTTKSLPNKPTAREWPSSAFLKLCCLWSWFIIKMVLLAPAIA